MVDKTWFPGLPALFEELQELTDKYRDVSIEFYIISGGLQAVIEGSPTVHQYVSGVYGCQLAESADTGVVAEVQRCVTFTEKTRFLFEINKGISAAEAQTKPHLVNTKIDAAQRPVPPFKHDLRRRWSDGYSLFLACPKGWWIIIRGVQTR